MAPIRSKRLAGRVADLSSSLPAGLSDSFLLQSEAMAHGLSTVRLPKNVVLAGPSGEVGALSFMNAESRITSFAAAALAGDRRHVRSLLRRAKLNVPPGRIFRLQSTDAAVRYAESIGFPVSVKLVKSESDENVTAGVTRPDGLVSAMTRIAPSGEATAVIVESQAAGEYLRFLILGDQVISVLRRAPTARRVRDGENIEVLDETHPDFHELALRSLGVIPGLDYGMVDIVAQQHTKAIAEQEVAVVEVSAAPFLAPHMSAAEGTASPICDVLVFHADRAGVKLKQRRETLSMSFTIEGIAGTDFVPDFDKLITEFSLSISLGPTRDQMGAITGVLEGSTEALALLSALAVSGRIGSEPAHMVELEPIRGDQSHSQHESTK